MPDAITATTSWLAGDVRRGLPRALPLALLVSAGLLAAAHLFERVGGYAPCLLCLEQREVHWIALGIGAVVVALTLGGWLRGSMLAVGLAAIAVVYVYSTGLASYHAGAEWGLWSGPVACSTAQIGGMTADVPSAGVLLAALEAPGSGGPSCEVAAWRFLGLSMAGYNALISLGLAAGLAAAAWHVVRRPAAPISS